MADITVRQVIDDLRSGVEAEMNEVVERILLTHQKKGDTIGVLIDAVADGATEAWMLAIHMANSLEEILQND